MAVLENTMRRRIEWGDCDPAGIVFNPNFFSYFDHATTLLYEAAGWPKQRMLAEYGIAGCPLVTTGATFKRPCRYGDDVEITSRVAEVRNSSFDIVHVLSLAGETCVEGKETRVWSEKDPETGRLRSKPIPDEIRARFEQGAAKG